MVHTYPPFSTTYNKIVLVLKVSLLVNLVMARTSLSQTYYTTTALVILCPPQFKHNAGCNSILKQGIKQKNFIADSCAQPSVARKEHDIIN